MRQPFPSRSCGFTLWIHHTFSLLGRSKEMRVCSISTTVNWGQASFQSWLEHAKRKVRPVAFEFDWKSKTSYPALLKIALIHRTSSRGIAKSTKSSEALWKGCSTSHSELSECSHCTISLGNLRASSPCTKARIRNVRSNEFIRLRGIFCCSIFLPVCSPGITRKASIWAFRAPATRH